jgi:hypothetical protein
MQLKTKTILQKGAMNDDGCDDDDDRQEQLSSQAAVLQGTAFLLVMEILGNGSVGSQILHFAKLPSTAMHRHSSSPSPLSLSLRLETIKSLAAPLCQVSC